MQNFLSNYSMKSSNLFFSGLCDDCGNPGVVLENVDVFAVNIEKYLFVATILGLVSLFGNCVTMTNEILNIVKRNVHNSREKKIYNILVFNLSFSNLLMGFYFIAGVIIHKVDAINASICNATEIVSSLSMVMSASILTIITAYRLYSILFPYKLVSIKLTVAILILVWFAWICVVSVPLFNEIAFANEFTSEVLVYDRNNMTRIELPKVYQTIKNLAQAINATDEAFSQVLNALSKYQSNEVAIQLLESFNLIDFKQYETELINYYHITGGCTFQVIFETRNHAITRFSLCIIFLNLAEYIFIIAAYIIMFKKYRDCVSETYFYAYQRMFLYNIYQK